MGARKDCERNRGRGLGFLHFGKLIFPIAVKPSEVGRTEQCLQCATVNPKP